MIGQTLGSYQVLARLGAGGMGEVYRARDSKLKREVALKVLPTDLATDRERLARFQREAEMLASLNHPNIAQIYGLEETALIMELVEGEDLAERLKRGPIPLDEALPVAKQIADALETAHEQGIIHRDLKPANIKVRPDGTVKVLDFGLAKAMDQGAGIGAQGSGHLANSPTITSPAMTMRGVILGTAAYMAPEQAKGKPVDRRADIWAFGCVFFEMLTGRKAFAGDDVTDTLTAVLRDAPDWTMLQYYRVAVDNDRPYNIYGGLQDNGCWKGPSASWTTNGILNEHWSRLCGGDGFFTVPDPANPRIVFSASQFLGIQRNDTRTWTTQDIRPGDPQGAIGGRRNWETWGKGVPQQVLGNEWHYANWDAPVVLSPFDSATVYAGGKHLFRSRDRGTTLDDLGDMTTGVDRSKLPVMGRLPDENILSVDDGVPFYPGITGIALSPLQKGLIYVGTDDGRLRMSTDDGKTWTDLADRLPGAPKSSWFGSIEASRHNANTVYVAMDNHRSNDFGNWIYKSTDGGPTFTNIAGNMPHGRVVRTLREDVKNPNLLFAGTEIGLWFTIDGGGSWMELKNNMPTLPFNDLVIHPRNNDLVLASHGRGIWILDGINALQELTPQVLASPAHHFTVAPAYQIRQTNLKAHTGDMWFRGDNPPNGAIIDYWIGTPGVAPVATVHTASGQLVQTLRAVSGGESLTNPGVQVR